jgi:hypothetical protein
LEKEKKRFVLTALALLSAFLVMIAALAYNPQGGAAASKQISAHGIVTDENGHPIENAIVFSESSSTTTNASGRYSFSYLYNFSADTKAMVAAVDNDRVRWCEISYFDASTSSSFEFNFILDSEKNVTVPLGILVSVSTIDNSTLLNLTLGKQMYLHAEQDVNEPTSVDIAMSFNNETKFNMQTVSFTSFVLCMNATVCGSYTDAGEVYNMHCNQTGKIFAVPIESEYLDYNNISSDCSTLKIQYGKNATVNAIQPASEANLNYRLPDSPYLSFSFDLLGKNVTFQESKIMNLDASQNINHLIHYSVPYLVSMTIEPLTAGDHVYEVYLENGCAIHIWERTV